MQKFNLNIQWNVRYVPIVVLICHFFFAISSYYVDSEIWPITVSKLFWSSGHHMDSIYSRPIFFGLLNIFHFLPLSNVSHLLTVKTFFILNFWFINYLAYRIFELTTKSANIATVSILFMLANPTWLAEGFRIRADFLALSLSLVSLFLFLRRTVGTTVLLQILLFQLAAILVTVKAVVWLLPMDLYILLSSNSRIGQKQKHVLYLALLSVVVVSITNYFLFLNVRNGVRTVIRYFLESSVFSHTFTKSQFLVDFLFVLTSLYASPIIWIFCIVAGIAAGFIVFQRNMKEFLKWLLVYMVLILSFLMFTPKTMFFWAAYTFFWSVPFAFVLTNLEKHLSGKWSKILVLALSLYSVTWLPYLYGTQNGQEIYQLISDIEDYCQDKQCKIFDSMGLLPKGQTTFSYVGLGDTLSNSYTLKNLELNPPNIILLTDRIKSYFPEIEEKVIQPKYFETSPNIYLLNTFENKKLFKSEIDPGSLFNQRVLWRRSIAPN